MATDNLTNFTIGLFVALCGIFVQKKQPVLPTRHGKRCRHGKTDQTLFVGVFYKLAWDGYEAITQQISLLSEWSDAGIVTEWKRDRCKWETVNVQVNVDTLRYNLKLIYRTPLYNFSYWLWIMKTPSNQFRQERTQYENCKPKNQDGYGAWFTSLPFL